jgi:NAD(P)-dependent dehydrogenase (short-subunit alcohol dehydrogenase family)
LSYTLTGFEGRVAVVTGTGRMRSIGHSIAHELARAGADVVVTGSGRGRTNAEEQAAGWRDIESVADEIRAMGRRALSVVTDIGDEASVEDLFAKTMAEFGRVDFLVNNAAADGGPDRVPVSRMATEQWDYVMRINLRGAFLMSRAFVREAAALGHGGAIVNISSVVGKTWPPNMTAYSGSKAGVHALTAGMAHEVGPNGIRVNALCPGVIDTARLGPFKTSGQFDEYVSERIPLRRAGTGEDLAAMTVFLCSEQGSWVSGQIISVDGGMIAR